MNERENQHNITPEQMKTFSEVFNQLGKDGKPYTIAIKPGGVIIINEKEEINSDQIGSDSQ